MGDAHTYIYIRTYLHVGGCRKLDVGGGGHVGKREGALAEPDVAGLGAGRVVDHVHGGGVAPCFFGLGRGWIGGSGHRVGQTVRGRTSF